MKIKSPANSGSGADAKACHRLPARHALRYARYNALSKIEPKNFGYDGYRFPADATIEPQYANWE